MHSADRFVLYYTTQRRAPTSSASPSRWPKRPEGPYVDSQRRAAGLRGESGRLHRRPSVHDGDGERYLYWKNDGNRVGVDTWISVQRLDESGTKLVGRAQRLFQQDLPWEGDLVEGPFVWEAGGRFVMFYSANAFASADYAVGDRHRASDREGPFTKQPEPILVSNDVAAGPGHCALFESDGKVWMVYHAWAPDAIGSEIPGRTMWLSEVTFGEGRCR